MFAMATFSRRHVRAALTAAPALIPGHKSAAQEQGFNEGNRKDLTANDVRFTIKGGALEVTGA
jgi:hypothetical protein